MMKKTMVSIAATALIILSAILMQMSDTDAREGEDEDEAKYLIGGGSTGGAVELGSGKQARISFNRTAFTSDASISFEIKGNGDYTSLVMDGNTGRGSTVTNGITVEIAAVNGDDGVYTVKFTPSADAETGKIFIRMTVEESVADRTLAQEFYYAANLATGANNAKLGVLNDDQSFFYRGSTGGTVPVMELEYDTPVEKWLFAEEYYELFGKTDWNFANGYEFYATGLPDGFAVRSDSILGGKLSSTVGTDATGTMTIYGVKEGVVTELQIPWKVGTKPAYDDADFKLIVDGAEVQDIIKVAGESIAVKAEQMEGHGTILSYAVTAGPLTATEGDDGWTIEGGQGTGTYVITVIAKMQYAGEELSVQKTCTVYVIGGIYDGNLKPVVKSI